MLGLRPSCDFAAFAAAALPADQPLRLVDIRRASDPDEGWRAFGERLQRLPLEIGGDHPARIAAEGFGAADVLLLDGGPGDLARLKALEPLLNSPGLLLAALHVEMSGGAQDPDTLHNLDRLMRVHGFDLFVLELVKTTAEALPWPFMDSHPGPSFGGRVAYGQAIYLRPTVDGLSSAKALKAAALRALVDLPDEAAALLLRPGVDWPPGFDAHRGLDLLTAQIQENTGGALPGYARYKAAVHAGDRQFYDFSARHNAWLQRLQATAREAPARIRALEDEVRVLTNALRAAAPAKAGPAARALAGVETRSRIHAGHHAVFDHFTPYRGPSRAPDHLDFIGSLTPAAYGRWPTPASVPDYEAEPPQIDEEYFEWIDILQAVLDAGPVFTMLELGAGYGRWSARAALAARQLGKAVRLGAAEAEPRHIAWLDEHLRRNGVAAADFRIFGQAVGGAYGEVAFTISAPAGAEDANWFGQAIMAADLKGLPAAGQYHGVPVYEQAGWRVILVPQIPLSEILEPYDLIDIADFDLQGAEGEAIAEAIEPLTRKVRRLHIGTHSEAIEAQLRELLPRHGWTKLRDYSLHKTHDTPFGRAAFVDGVQSWINPSLI